MGINDGMEARIRRLLSDAYIIGGAPCSGKSTLAEMLADRNNLDYYQVDDHQEEHLQRARPESQPVMCRYRLRDWNDIWMQSPDVLLTDLLEFDTERFPFILHDLALHTGDRPLLVQGAAIWPQFLDGLPLTAGRVIFMISAPEFQITHYRQRSWIKPILDACSDPQAAFEHWMKRDSLFGAALATQAIARGFATICVDGSASVDQLYGQICNRFGLSIA